MDLTKIMEEIASEVSPLIGQGHVADYIPILSEVPIGRFGMAVCMLDGQTHIVGDALASFSIQSISKVFALTLALKTIGEEQVFRRVGREPSGSPFNSLVQLEYENGLPRNPFINAGALVIDDILVSSVPAPHECLRDFVREMACNPAVDYDRQVARSEKEDGYRNRALANFLKSYANLHCDVDAVLDLYFSQCALAMSCVDLAKSFLYLANWGTCPHTGQVVISRSQAKRISALMMTCGTYDGVGEFAYLVGLPAKSGVGGGIVAVIPGKLVVAVWSPGLDKKGNSLAGTKALELFTTKTGISVF
jgi:glutaminase